MGNITKRQHYVYRAYLRSWADNEDLVWCIINQTKLTKTNLMNIAQSSYFYKQSEPYSLNELEFLYRLAQGNKQLMPYQMQMIDSYNGFINLYQTFKGYPNDDLARRLDEKMKQSEENIQGIIERLGLPILEKLKQGDISFLDNFDNRSQLYYFVAEQMSRTRKVKEDLSAATNTVKWFVDTAKIMNPLSHIASQKIAFMMVAQKYGVVLMESKTCKNFITGDQPVVAIKDKENVVEYYYPITPKISILLSPKDNHKDKTKIVLSYSQIEYYNNLIKEESKYFLIAKEEKDLI